MQTGSPSAYMMFELVFGKGCENLLYKRGDVFWTELSPVVGSEQNGLRPAVILQNNIGNRHSPTVIIAPLTTNLHKGKNLPTHVQVRLEGFPPSVVLLEQVRTVDKCRLGKLAGHLDDHTMAKIGECILLCLGL